MKNYKIVVFVPVTHATELREAMGDAGGGIVGNYSYCTFGVRGVGRFLPNEGANPTIGEVGTLQAVDEERFETGCSEDNLQEVLSAIRAVHPYEEPVIDVYLLEDVTGL